MVFSAKQIADFLGGTIEGDTNVIVSNFSKIEEGKPGTLSFLANLKYASHIYDTHASIVLVNNDFVPENPLPSSLTLIRVPNAYMALATLMEIVNQSKNAKKGIEQPVFISSSSAVDAENTYVGAFTYIGENVKLGKNVSIYPQAFIGNNVEIGDNTTIYAGVKIYEDCRIGKNCIIHSGAVIGADGFGFAPDGEKYKKIPQLGNVIIEDDVEIGANTTIDRAVMGSTVIRSGVKLDNLIQIAHNVEVGENTVMAAQVGVAGSVKVGKHCMFAGQVGIAGHLQIADNVMCGAQAGVIGNINESTTVLGMPAINAKKFMRSSAIFGKLPDIYRTIGELQKDVENLKDK